jgi:hypothetical protein
MKAILVTGPSDWLRRQDVAAALREHAEPGDVVVHGCAPGVDSIADDAATEQRLPVVRVPYIGWLRSAGGPVRNELMASIALGLVRSGAADSAICLAFGDGTDRGTKHCARNAALRGLPVEWVR